MPPSVQPLLQLLQPAADVNDAPVHEAASGVDGASREGVSSGMRVLVGMLSSWGLVEDRQGERLLTTAQKTLGDL